MKFLGEFIQHFVSRFRNDIFLEDVSSGTIASGGYLGLDSNNKIVKASTVGSGVDLTSEVTGVLPVSNGGTGASTLASDSVLTGNGTSAVQAETHLTWSASTETLSVEGDSSSKPIVKIQNNNTDATPGELKFRKLSNVADGDHLGKITFVGFAPSGSPTDVEFATILGEVNEADDGDEEGKLTLSVASHDGESQPGVTIVSGNAEDEVDVTIANGATSLTTIAGTLTMGSTAFVNNSGVIQVATQGTIDHDSLANFVAAEHYRWDTDISSTATIHTNNITDLHGAGVDGSANQLLTDDGDGTITSEANLTFDSGSLQVINSTIPLITLKRTSTGSDNDTVAAIRFTGNDDADNALRYAAISAKIIDASDGAEEGQLNLAVASHDGEEVTGLSLTSGNAEDEVDVTIGNGTTSLTTVAGTLTMGSTATLNNSGVLQVAAQPNITSLGTLTTLTVDDVTINGDTITASADLNIVATGDDINIDTDNFIIESTAGNKPDITLKATGNHNKSPLLQFVKDKGAAGAADDAAGTILFEADNDAQQLTPMAGVVVQVEDATDDAEEGRFTVSVKNTSSTGTTASFTLTGNGTATDASIGSGSASVTTIAGTLTMGSTATLDNSGNLLNNAATATALTSGDKTIEGNLRIGGSGDTSNNWISIDAQNGDDSSGGGITFYETGTYSVSAPQYGAKIVYNEDDDELAIGTMHNNTFMRQIHMDRGSSAVYLTNLAVQNDDTNGPYVYLKNLDTSITDGQNLARHLVYTADRDASISRINWVATEDHDSDSGGNKIDFLITPNGNGQSETIAMTIGQDSSLTVNGNIELGHASDTTIARSAAGTVTVEGNQVVTAGVGTGNLMHILLKDMQSYMFYIFNDDSWYSAGTGTVAVLGSSTDPSDLSSGNSEYQSRIASYIATQACVIKKLCFQFYWSSSVVNSADIDFGFSKFTPISDGTAASITMNKIDATDHNGSYTEAAPYYKIFTFSGSNATLAAGDAFGFHMRTTGGSSSQRVLVYGTGILEVELS